MQTDEKNPTDKIVGSTDGLERCPFCGETARMRTDGVTTIACDGCGVYVSLGYGSTGRLRDVWNRRSNAGLTGPDKHEPKEKQ